MSFGLNDGQLMDFDRGRARPFVPFPEYESITTAMARRIVEDCSCPVILWTLPRVGSDYAGELGKRGQKAQLAAFDRIRGLQRRIAKESGLVFADVFRAMEENDFPDLLIYDDSYHPGARAQPVIAAALFSAWEESVKPAGS